jgi:hypothetical protein
VIIADLDRKPFMDAMSGIYHKSLSDQRIKSLVERIRQVQ